VNADLVSNFGCYLLDLNNTTGGVAWFQMNAWAHHESASAEDSLSDGYLAAGDRKNAAASLQHAIALAATDPSMDAAARARFVASEKEGLETIMKNRLLPRMAGLMVWSSLGILLSPDKSASRRSSM
jgi:hypothetical protein